MPQTPKREPWRGSTCTRGVEGRGSEATLPVEVLSQGVVTAPSNTPETEKSRSIKPQMRSKKESLHFMDAKIKCSCFFFNVFFFHISLPLNSEYVSHSLASQFIWQFFLLSFCLFVCFLATPHSIWGSSNQRWNPCPLQWKHRVLTTGPPGNSPSFLVSLKTLFKKNFYWDIIDK